MSMNATMQRPTMVPTVKIAATLTSYEQYAAAVIEAACTLPVEAGATSAAVASLAPITAVLPDPLCKWWLA